MNKLTQFEDCSESILNPNKQSNGIGTLSEKSLHAYLKLWLQPNSLFHEQKLHRYVCDIFDGERIIEIQTKQLFKLKPKLDLFLDEYPLTIVYPIAHIKTLSWINAENGEVSKARKSPKTGSIYDGIEELYGIKAYLKHPNLTIQFIFFDVYETRYLNGWSEDKKRGAHRHDRIPIEFKHTILFNKATDFDIFLPNGLEDFFTTQDISKKLKIKLKKAQMLCGLLSDLERITTLGKQGRFKLYFKTIQ